MDQLITTCKNSAGVRWFTQFQNVLWTTLPHSKRRRDRMFYSDSDDSGISVSPTFFITRNNSINSSTESINTLVEQYKSKQRQDSKNKEALTITKSRSKAQFRAQACSEHKEKNKPCSEAQGAKTIKRPCPGAQFRKQSFSEAQVRTQPCTERKRNSRVYSEVKDRTERFDEANVIHKPCQEAEISNLHSMSKTSIETIERSIRKGSVISIPFLKPVKFSSTLSLCCSLPNFGSETQSEHTNPKCGFPLYRHRRNSHVFHKQPCLKLCLQYFGNGHQLRTILLNTKNMAVEERLLFAKCTIYRNNKKIKCCSKKIHSADLKKINAEILFNNLHFQQDKSMSLSVKLYSKKSAFSFKKCIGKTSLPLSGVDLFMNKTFYCLLRPGQSNDMTFSNETFHIVSTDESIRTRAKASLTASAIGLFALQNQSSSQFTWKPSCSLE